MSSREAKLVPFSQGEEMRGDFCNEHWHSSSLIVIFAIYIRTCDSGYYAQTSWRQIIKSNEIYRKSQLSVLFVGRIALFSCFRHLLLLLLLLLLWHRPLACFELQDNVFFISYQARFISETTLSLWNKSRSHIVDTTLYSVHVFRHIETVTNIIYGQQWGHFTSCFSFLKIL
jgi:hypothetical protein